ncbi:MAG: hypothetical protein AABX83_01785 [Nanoarchaeota archaeon]
MTTNQFPIVNEWLKYAVLLHYNDPRKPDHHDIALDIINDEESEKLSLDKLETVELDLFERKLPITPFELIRKRYLEYEGAMSENRGFVRRVDEGRYKLLRNDHLLFDGKVLSGEYDFREEGENLYLCKL